ncbi:recombinase family protein [Bacteroides pyogenes]|jgi:DNA invertase Pin-like site-specific DNA recombinase|uniref:Recombinase family protein n=1 Tax=Bacteroides pyogenes TaxID=310300 RepID=A0A5D3EB10_9BACE|nr:recombinase family protein [Bacteroides pyogenes]TYK32806.1 recombinase family protein [Bacteroides pyogenes]
MIFGYARVSKLNQNLERQINELKKEGCERIYQEKMTGTRKERPELSRMMDALREGDVIIVCELTRLSRSVKDLFNLIEQINDAGANIKSLKEPWLNTTTPHGRLLFAVFSGVSQFERDIIRERTLEGMAAARARGRKGGRPKKDSQTIKLAINLYESKACSIGQILKTTGISRSTLYSYIKKHKQ